MQLGKRRLAPIAGIAVSTAVVSGTQAAEPVQDRDAGLWSRHRRFSSAEDHVKRDPERVVRGHLAVVNATKPSIDTKGRNGQLAIGHSQHRPARSTCHDNRGRIHPALSRRRRGPVRRRSRLFVRGVKLCRSSGVSFQPLPRPNVADAPGQRSADPEVAAAGQPPPISPRTARRGSGRGYGCSWSGSSACRRAGER